MTKDEVRRRLIALADEKHKSFTGSLMPGVEGILGVKIPLLRKMAKEIAREGAKEYLCEASIDTFEERVLKGLVIGGMKGPFCEILPYIDTFVGEIDSWAVCDSFCSSLKITLKNKREMWEYINKKILSRKEFEIRFAVVMMLEYYVDDDHVKEILYLLNAVKHEGYYVKMAVAWAVSVCYVKYKEITHAYLTKCDLDDFTRNKAIQKIRESYRVDAESKESLKVLKRPKTGE